MVFSIRFCRLLRFCTIALASNTSYNQIMRLFAGFIVLLIFLFVNSSSYAQSSVGLEASVGRFYFSASGIVSPFASVVMTSQDYFLSSTVANEKGEFVLPPALVNDGFDEFCLEAIDIRRIGTSYTCFEVDPPTRDFEKDRIFLPPTVGLSGRKIEPNSPITASGYSMPGALVDVNVSSDIKIEARADGDGYYNTELEGGTPGAIPSGTYELYATATFGSNKSEVPTRTFRIEVLGLINAIPAWFVYIGLFLLLLLILLLVLFFILRKRRRKEDKNKPKSKKKANRFHLPFLSHA